MEELNIGLDGLIFVDDDPTERELARQMLLVMEAPEFPKQPHMPSSSLTFLLDRHFRVYPVAEED